MVKTYYKTWLEYNGSDLILENVLYHLRNVLVQTVLCHVSTIFPPFTKGTQEGENFPHPYYGNCSPSHGYITEDWADAFLSDGLNFMYLYPVKMHSTSHLPSLTCQ